jgi:hypothetical protein
MFGRTRCLPPRLEFRPPPRNVQQLSNYSAPTDFCKSKDDGGGAVAAAMEVASPARSPDPLSVCLFPLLPSPPRDFPERQKVSPRHLRFYRKVNFVRTLSLPPALLSLSLLSFSSLSEREGDKEGS